MSDLHHNSRTTQDGASQQPLLLRGCLPILVLAFGGLILLVAYPLFQIVMEGNAGVSIWLTIAACLGISVFTAAIVIKNARKLLARDAELRRNADRIND